MKRVLLLAMATFGVAQLGAAASCISGSLTAYAALGSTGCTINNSTVSNFQVFTTGTFGATEISPLSVTIAPTGGLYNPGLTISTTQTTSTSLLEIFFTYQISGQMYVGAATGLSGSSETGFGAVSNVINYCSGGTFDATGVSGCTGSAGTLLTLDGAQQNDLAGFSRVSSIAVTNDFTIDASAGGSASGGTFTNSFTAVPEPVTTAFTGLGLVLLAATRFRFNRANQENN